MQSSFSSRRGSAILAAVLLRLRLPRLLPISYFHHEESPELEQGHGEYLYVDSTSTTRTKLLNLRVNLRVDS